jgi:hypothetical protein
MGGVLFIAGLGRFVIIKLNRSGQALSDALFLIHDPSNHVSNSIPADLINVSSLCDCRPPSRTLAPVRAPAGAIAANHGSLHPLWVELFISEYP